MACQHRAEEEDNAARPEPSGKHGKGRLYLVSTPIGNLEDVTLRALRILREADIVACEDTRRTLKLFHRFQIATKRVRYDEHTEHRVAAELVRRIEAGASVALVSDAGTPCISDPGYRLVELCLSRGIPVIPIPGPSAVLAALVASGLPTHRFQFVGFPPSKRAARRRFLSALADFPSTTVFFEAPHRIRQTLEDVLNVLGNRRLVVAREVSKVHEEFRRGRCSEILELLRQGWGGRGEMTVLIGPPEQPTPSRSLPGIRERVEELIRIEGLDRMEALKKVAQERGISKHEAYRGYHSAQED